MRRRQAVPTSDHGIIILASSIDAYGNRYSRRRGKCGSFLSCFGCFVIAAYFYLLFLVNKRASILSSSTRNSLVDPATAGNDNTALSQKSSSPIIANSPGAVVHKSVSGLRFSAPKKTSPGPNPPTIPRRLIFTYKYNLLDPTENDPPFNATDLITANVLSTIHKYQTYWKTRDAVVKARYKPEQQATNNHTKEEEEVVVSFLSDNACLDIITKVEPRLSRHFQRERKGEFKADICRVAELYVHGGYYFDIDIGVVRPINFAAFHLPSSKPDVTFNLKAIGTSMLKPPSKDDIVTFASIYNRQGRFFQAFTAATPGHPVLKLSLEYMVAYYEDNLEQILPEFLVQFLMGRSRGDQPFPSRKEPNGMGVGPFTLSLAQRATTDDEWEEYAVKLMKDHGYTKAANERNARMGEHIPAKRRYARYLYEVSLEDKVVKKNSLFSNVPLQDAEYTKKNHWCNYACFAGPWVYFYSRVRGSKGCPLES